MNLKLSSKASHDRCDVIFFENAIMTGEAASYSIKPLRIASAIAWLRFFALSFLVAVLI